MHALFARRIGVFPPGGFFWSAPCRLFARNGEGHRTLARWREESFEDLHPRGSGSGYDAVTDLLITLCVRGAQFVARENAKSMIIGPDASA